MERLIPGIYDLALSITMRGTMVNKNIICLLALLAAWPGVLMPASAQPVDNPNPPAQPVKLIFIHHSTGGNWLADPTNNEQGGGLGRALMENNYFVSATNYGWGPDGIGDRTDIINWPEWFTGPNRDTILTALYTEYDQNFGDFGDWPRLTEDPGGENQIILFKSCFPNSNLEGSPNDPPATTINEDMTVANAKAVYNNLLTYFTTRPDKLFIVITAPPLADFETDAASAANARAFNNWLVNDWLSSYTLANVVVFDFYNVLTSGPGASQNDAGQTTGNHHRWWDGAVQHLQTVDNNVLVYPSGDSHPTRAGNEKATSEFVPLLNVYYNRWKASAPASTPKASPQPTNTQAATTLSPIDTPLAQVPPSSDRIDDFESTPPGTTGWQPSRDEATATTIACAPATGLTHEGAHSLQIVFNVTANSWATCALFFDQPQDWSAWQGISFYLHASQPSLVFDVDVYRNTPQGRETYLFTLEAPPESVEGWAPVAITWEQLMRASWEANPGTPFSAPLLVEGLAFGFNTFPDTSNLGGIFVDDLHLANGGELQNIGAAAPSPASTEPPNAQVTAITEEPADTELAKGEIEQLAVTHIEPTQTPEKENKARNPVCPSALVAPLAVIALTGWLRKRGLNADISI
jgi:hypothetical protein